ncbi:MAG: DUF2157 domain-containing protein, partial [Smithella sp.]
AGILFLAAGLGMTLKRYASEIAADIIIITALTAVLTASLAYCFVKGKEYTKGESPAPGMFFDYILYLACIIYSLEIAYIETRFAVFGDFWRLHLLISSFLFFFLAYRFDNRLVLSFALSTLAGWLGFELHSANWVWESMRFTAIGYGLACLAAGAALYSYGIKRHFLDIYLNFAAHFVLIALVSGVFGEEWRILYFIALCAACAAAIVYAQKNRNFLYLVYAVIYGYIGLSSILLRNVTEASFIYMYVIASSAAIIWWLFSMSKKYQERA